MNIHTIFRTFLIAIIFFACNGCTGEKFQLFSSSFEKNDEKDNVISVDGMQIIEFTKDYNTARIYCDENRKLIKLKIGSSEIMAQDHQDGYKMPEKDHLSMANGTTDMVVTLGTPRKGKSIVVDNISIFVTGKDDGEEEKQKAAESDFVYRPCVILDDQEEEEFLEKERRKSNDTH